MGLFDSMCAESGLIIDSKQQLIAIVEEKARWVPMALPIGGTNDRGGTMDVPKKLDANMKLVVALGKQLAYKDEDVKAAKVDLGTMLDAIRGDGNGATWNGKNVAFSLIEGGVYAAIVKAVTANGATAWTRYAQVGLQTPELPLPYRQKPKRTPKPPVIDKTTKRLCEAILAAPKDEATRKVYVDHLLAREEPRGKLLAILPVIKKLTFEALAELALPHSTVVYGAADKAALRPALVDFVRFLAWGTTFAVACGEGQFFGYEDKYDLQGGAQPYVERAQKKYAGMPELLAVVEANADAFRERGAQNDDDDDDD